MSILDTYTVVMNFNDGSGDHDLSDQGLVLADGFSKQELFMNSSWHSVINKCNFKLKYDATIISKLLTNPDTIDVTITKNGSAWFAGFVPPNLALAAGDYANGGEIEVWEYSHRLKEKLNTTQALDSYYVFYKADTDWSIIHQLLFDFGYSAADIDSSAPDILEYVDYFYEDIEDKTYFEIINTLLFEMGYVMEFTLDGKYSHAPWIVDSVTIAGTIDDDDQTTSPAFSIDRTYTHEKAVEVVFSELEELNNVALYGEHVPIQTNGEPEGISLLAWQFFPARGAVETIYQKYVSKFVQAALENYDAQLIYADNQVVRYSADDGIRIDTENHYPLKSQVVFENNSGLTQKLYYFDIWGDAVVRARERKARSEILSGTTRVKKYVSLYVFDEDQASKLAQGIRNALEYADFTYKFGSENEYDLGGIYTLQNTTYAVDTTVIITEKVEVTESYKYEYKAVGITEYTTATATLTTIFAAALDQTFYQGGIVTVAAAGAKYSNPNYLCDGDADQVQISAAIAAMSGSGGGTVRLIGHFIVNDSITVLSNVKIELTPDTIIQVESYVSAFSMFSIQGTAGDYVDNVIVTGGKLLRATAGVSTAAMVYFNLDYASAVMISGVTIDAAVQSYLSTVLDVDYSENILFANNTVYGGKVSGTMVNVISIVGNRFFGRASEEDAFSFHTGPLVYFFNMNASEEVVDNVFRDYRFTSGMRIIMLTDGIANRNIIEDIEVWDSTLFEPIYVDGDASVVAENKIKNAILYHSSDSRAIHIQRFSPDIWNNTVRNCSGGIVFSPSYSTDRPSIKMNTLLDCGNMIDYGMCRHSLGDPDEPPRFAGESGDSVLGGTFTHDYNAYAYKLNASGVSNAQVFFQSSYAAGNMHGTLPGITYTGEVWVKIPSTGGPAYSTVGIEIADEISGSWDKTTQYAVNTLDEYQKITISRTIRTTATGVYFKVMIDSGPAEDEYIHVRKVRFFPAGSNNQHGNLYKEV